MIIIQYEKKDNAIVNYVTLDVTLVVINRFLLHFKAFFVFFYIVKMVGTVVSREILQSNKKLKVVPIYKIIHTNCSTSKGYSLRVAKELPPRYTYVKIMDDFMSSIDSPFH